MFTSMQQPLRPRLKPLQPPTTWLASDFDVMSMLAIFQPEQQVTVVPRTENTAIRNYLQQMAPRMGHGIRLTMSPDASSEQLDSEMHLPAGDGKQALLDDIARLNILYADLLGCAHVGLRLEVLQQAMCPKFHIDRTGIRMLCTYLGPGTEWLAEEDCQRSAFNQSHTNIEQFHRALILNPHSIQQASPFDLVLLKGSRWQGNQQAGAVHRSPAMRPEQLRVVLALDALW